MRRRPGVLGVIAACVLGACARFHDRSITAEGHLQLLESGYLTNPKVGALLERSFPDWVIWPVRTWNADALIFAAFYFNPELNIARAQLARARCARVSAAARPNPMIMPTPTDDTTTSPPWIRGLSFDLPIETAGKRRYRQDQAAHPTEAAMAILSISAWIVRSRARGTLLSLYAALEREPLHARQEASQAESVGILEEELELGSVSPFEVTQSRIALNQTRFALQDTRRDIADTRTRLAAAIGVTQRALEGVRLDFAAFKQPPPQVLGNEARRQAVLNRPELRAALDGYAASQSALQVEIAKQYPDLHLLPGYQLDQTDNKWTLGFGFELPIFNQHQGPIAEAETRRAEMAAKFDALQTSVLIDIERAVSGYQAAQKTMASANILIGDLQRQFRTAHGMFALGGISKIELAQRQVELATAHLAQLDASVAAQDAFSALEGQLHSPAAVSAVTARSPHTEATTRTQANGTEPDLPRLVQVIPLPQVKGGFDLMTVDVDGGRLFVDAEDNDTTEVIDLSAARSIHTITGMHAPKWVVYRPELNRLYVANGDGAVRSIDATTFKLLRTITFKEKANNLQFDPGTGELFVGVGETFGAIAVINTRTDSITGQIPLASYPKQFALDGDRIYVNVPEASHVAVINRSARAVVATWPLATAKRNVPLDLDRVHHRLFIGFSSGKFAVVDTMSGKELAALDIAEDPDGIYYDAARAVIYVSCGAGWMHVIKQVDADHYVSAGRVATAKGAATSLFVPLLDRLFLAVPQRDSKPAEIRIYQVGSQ